MLLNGNINNLALKILCLVSTILRSYLADNDFDTYEMQLITYIKICESGKLYFIL